ERNRPPTGRRPQLERLADALRQHRAREPRNRPDRVRAGVRAQQAAEPAAQPLGGGQHARRRQVQLPLRHARQDPRHGAAGAGGGGARAVPADLDQREGRPGAGDAPAAPERRVDGDLHPPPHARRRPAELRLRRDLPAPLRRDGAARHRLRRGRRRQPRRGQPPQGRDAAARAAARRGGALHRPGAGADRQGQGRAGRGRRDGPAAVLGGRGGHDGSAARQARVGATRAARRRGAAEQPRPDVRFRLRARGPAHRPRGRGELRDGVGRRVGPHAHDDAGGGARDVPGATEPRRFAAPAGAAGGG
ncbi:MAG: hypothetical protein AVDCRST_MAG31-1612, partial [uncultured Sphingomonas sp.]